MSCFDACAARTCSMDLSDSSCLSVCPPAPKHSGSAERQLPISLTVAQKYRSLYFSEIDSNCANIYRHEKYFVFGLHRQMKTDTVCTSQCLCCTDSWKQTLCVHHTVWVAQTDENRHCVFIALFGLHRQKQTLCVYRNVWVAQTDENRHCVFIAFFGLHRQKQTLCVHRNVWVAQTDENRHYVLITVFGLHRQMKTDTVCSSQCLVAQTVCVTATHQNFESDSTHFSP